MRTTMITATLLMLMAALPADRPQFDWEQDQATGGGLVTMDGNVLFEIREPAGGWQPIERAEIVAGRLERLYPWIKPGNVRVGRMNHETVVELLAPKAGAPRGRPAQLGRFLIVTVDEATAKELRKTKWLLAHWWRDLFRDYIRIAHGRKPSVTYRFSGAVRQYWDANVNTGFQGGKALEAMPRASRRALKRQYRNVPAAYAPAAPDIPPKE